MIIEYLTLHTHTPELQYRFYSKLLGLPGKYNKRNGHVEIKVGLTVLRFVPAPAPPYYHFAFNIPPLLYASALEWLHKRTTVLPNEEGRELVDFSNWKAYAMYFFDPAGNIVEFIARRDLPNGDATAFSPELIRSVSEIGLPVDDVAAASEKLKTGAGIPFYSGDNETFNALGNPEGLFIIVDRKEKTWYPTGKRALRFPVRGRFRQGEKSFTFQLSSEGLDVRPASGKPQ